MMAAVRLRNSTALLAAFAALTLDGVARADLPPPADYVDPCESAVLDESCQRCGSPEFKSPECHVKAREGGLVQRCQAWSYTMYCREGGAAAAEAVKPAEAPAATPPAASCAVVGTGDGWAIGGLVLVALAPLRRRRARGR